MAVAEAVDELEQARELLAKLTPRELEVVHLVADGLSNPDIADALYVEPCTVRNHLSHAYKSMGISNRIQLARLLWVYESYR